MYKHIQRTCQIASYVISVFCPQNRVIITCKRQIICPHITFFQSGVVHVYLAILRNHFLHVSIKRRNSLIRPIGLVMIMIYMFSSLITTPILYNRGGKKVKRQIHVDTCDIILICNVEFGKPYVSYVSMTAKFLVTYWSNYKIPKLHLCNDGFHNLEFVVIQTSIA